MGEKAKKKDPDDIQIEIIPFYAKVALRRINLPVTCGGDYPKKNVDLNVSRRLLYLYYTELHLSRICVVNSGTHTRTFPKNVRQDLPQIISKSPRGLGPTKVDDGGAPKTLQRIREDMTRRFQKQEVGSWKLEVGFSQLCTRSLFRTKIHESFSYPMNKVD